MASSCSRAPEAAACSWLWKNGVLRGGGGYDCYILSPDHLTVFAQNNPIYGWVPLVQGLLEMTVPGLVWVGQNPMGFLALALPSTLRPKNHMEGF